MNTHTIYDELRAIAIKMGVNSTDLGKTHNIRDLVALIGTFVGSDGNARNIAEAVTKMDGYVDILPILDGLVIDTDIGEAVDLFGKVIGDLQSNITIANGVVSGTLNYVSDYTGFSSDVKLQSGHYIALHAEVNDVNGSTIYCTLSSTKALDPDGIVILRITDPDVQTVVFTAKKDGYADGVQRLSLKGLVLADAVE